MGQEIHSTYFHKRHLDGSRLTLKFKVSRFCTWQYLFQLLQML